MTYFQVYKVRHSYEAVYAMKFSNELMINFLILINVFLSCLKMLNAWGKRLKVSLSIYIIMKKRL